ncbi:MogA/MoaB family molybdenum cofactor biosynthesis protein [Metabacillus sp. RGM 3146]|uniref:MogA/MoaB family molybdenum cofactor biosynthesis protein n=1 Tax=Metabacillus sp. RGM 3146 TaxID=3401092 RepID=UPI003B9D5ADC
MSVEEHKTKAPASVACSIITVSDTRTEETDKSGALIRDLLITKGHEVTDYQIIKDEQTLIKNAVLYACENSKIKAVIVNGGTGIATRDVTIEAVHPLLDKEMPGFGEIFRSLSYFEDIGSSAILSRALAGTASNTAVFVIPGSSGAVKLAMEKLILPELGHIIREIQKDL